MRLVRPYLCSVNCSLPVMVFLLTKVRLLTLRILCSFKQLPLVVESEVDLNEVSHVPVPGS